jgi:ADP-heptose:LPS heptosyltransferase
MNQERILVIQLRQLGDILLTTPLIRSLRHEFPHAHIAVLTHSMGKKILYKNPYIDEHLCYNSMSFFSLITKLRCYSTVLDCMNNPRSALHTYLARNATIKVSFQKKKSPRSWVYNTSTTTSPHPYIVYEKLMFLKTLSTDFNVLNSDISLDLFIEPEDRLFAENTISPNKSGGKNIILAATHRRENRRWPYFSELAKALEANNHRVFWLWGPGEHDEVKTHYQGCGSIMPETTFRQMAACIEKADYLIANSNGPSHVAVAMKTPSLQIHGPTQAQSWCPPVPEHKAAYAYPIEDLKIDKVLNLLNNLN